MKRYWFRLKFHWSLFPRFQLTIFQHCPWWRHQMETFSALLAICAGNSLVPGEFPTQRPVTRSFEVYFDLRPNKRLSKQSWGWWFETQSRPLWRHRNVQVMIWHCLIQWWLFYWRIYASLGLTELTRASMCQNSGFPWFNFRMGEPPIQSAPTWSRKFPLHAIYTTLIRDCLTWTWDVLFTWWRHQMESFSALLAFCAGNSSVPGEFPSQRPVTRSFDVFFDLCWMNAWVNNREAGDLRRHRVHYDVIVMKTVRCILFWLPLCLVFYLVIGWFSPIFLAA